MSNLYQDAILDAKALRASAMANAKAALEEAFEPKIQEMISKHLSEEEENMEKDYGMGEEGAMHDGEVSEDINEAELEEILNQLEEMSAPEESLNEAEEEDEKEEEEDEEDEEGGEDTAEGEVSDETKVIEITVGDLKEILKSVMPGAEAMPAAEEPTADSEAEEEVSLEEILSELENEGMEDTAQNPTTVMQTPGEQLENEGLNEEPVSIMATIAGITALVTAAGGLTAIAPWIRSKMPNFTKQLSQDAAKGQAPSSSRQSLEEEDMDQDAVTAFLQTIDDNPQAAKEFVEKAVKLDPEKAKAALEKAQSLQEGDVEAWRNVILTLLALGGAPAIAAAIVKKYAKGFAQSLSKSGGIALKNQPLDTDTSMGAKNELAQAKSTIAELRKNLQEVNLLNAKYLYMNKLFKSKSLTESQKLKVINTLDRATTVKEVKTAYQIMSESLEIQKGQLKESIGFASKPAGMAPKANIVESEQFINRWQKLAGIKK